MVSTRLWHGRCSLQSAVPAPSSRRWGTRGAVGERVCRAAPLKGQKSRVGLRQAGLPSVTSESSGTCLQRWRSPQLNCTKQSHTLDTSHARGRAVIPICRIKIQAEIQQAVGNLLGLKVMGSLFFRRKWSFLGDGTRKSRPSNTCPRMSKRKHESTSR